MNDGIFLSLSKSYFIAAGNTFSYSWNVTLLLKPVALVVAILYVAVLTSLGIVFRVLIIFDWIGSLTDAIRKFLLELIDKQSRSIDNSLLSFLFRPIFLVILSPFFLLSVFIPKLSSNVLANMAANELSDFVSGAGAFKRINTAIWEAARRLFTYISQAPLLLQPITAIMAIIYSAVLLTVGTIFFILVPLDWISGLIENMRQWTVQVAHGQQRKIRYSVGTFLFSPLLLIALSPIFLVVILIPKLTTSLDLEV